MLIPPAHNVAEGQHGRAFGPLLLPALVMFFLAGLFVPAQAQPSEAQIRKDITGAKTISCTLGKPGEKVWNSTRLKYEWTRGATCKVKSDYPDINVIVKGAAVYDIIGARFVYTRFRVFSNEYEGIPNPGAAEINEMLRKAGLHGGNGLLGNADNGTVGEVESIRMADDPQWEWHTPNSVSFNVVMVYDYVMSYTEVARREATHRLRFYRENPKQTWLRMISSTEGQPRVLDKKTYTSEQVRKMQTQKPTRVPQLQ